MQVKSAQGQVYLNLMDAPMAPLPAGAAGILGSGGARAAEAPVAADGTEAAGATLARDAAGSTWAPLAPSAVTTPVGGRSGGTPAAPTAPPAPDVELARRTARLAQRRVEAHAQPWTAVGRRERVAWASACRWRQLGVAARQQAALLQPRVVDARKQAEAALRRAEISKGRGSRYEAHHIQQASDAVDRLNAMKANADRAHAQAVEAGARAAADVAVADQAAIEQRRLRADAPWRATLTRLIRERNAAWEALARAQTAAELPFLATAATPDTFDGAGTPPPKTGEGIAAAAPDTGEGAAAAPDTGEGAATVQAASSEPATLATALQAQEATLARLRPRFAHVPHIVDDEGETWPNPFGKEADALIAELVRQTRSRGAYANNWQISALANAAQQPTMLWSRQASGTVLRTATFGPDPQPGQAVKHLLLERRGQHYVAFSPHDPGGWHASGALATTGTTRDFGGGGDCLYHAFGESRDPEHVMALRRVAADELQTLLHANDDELAQVLHAVILDHYDKYCLAHAR